MHDRSALTATKKDYGPNAVTGRGLTIVEQLTEEDDGVHGYRGLHDSLVMGTPEQAIEKLRLYEEAGVDLFCYGVNVGLPWSDLVRSLELFIERVMPAFAEAEPAGTRQRAAASS